MIAEFTPDVANMNTASTNVVQINGLPIQEDV